MNKITKRGLIKIFMGALVPGLLKAGFANSYPLTKEDTVVAIKRDSDAGIKSLEETLSSNASFETGTTDITKDSISKILHMHACTLELSIASKTNQEKAIMAKAAGVIIDNQGHLFIPYHFGSSLVSLGQYLNQSKLLDFYNLPEYHNQPAKMLLRHQYSGLIKNVECLAYFNTIPYQSFCINDDSTLSKLEIAPGFKNDFMLCKVEVPQDFEITTLPIASSIPRIGDTVYIQNTVDSTIDSVAEVDEAPVIYHFGINTNAYGIKYFSNKGSSGKSVINRQGELCGLVVGTNFHPLTIISNPLLMRKLIEGYIG